jgi:hypothetical protein
MVQLAIRCHPVIPVPADELEGWLEDQMNDLRAAAPLGIIRLSRLAQGRPRSECYVGWLVELELPQEDPLLAGDRLVHTLRDMRLLGLQPTLLAPTPRDGDPLVGSSHTPATNGAGS